MSADREAIADQLWRARLEPRSIAKVPDLDLPSAYAIAAYNHARRLAAGERAIGRKIGHTRRENWAAQGMSAPSWGWLYADSCWPAAGLVLDLGRWREPKVELELMLQLRCAPPHAAGPAALADCIAAMALGLEWVDRPYADWNFPVAASIAAGGVHAGMVMGPVMDFDPALPFGDLRAELRVGDQCSEGGSSGVLGSPLQALAALAEVLHRQHAPALQAGEWITTGALAPALAVRAGQRLRARIEGPGGFSLSLDLPTG